NARAGGNYAQVLFKTGPKGGAAGSSVSVAGELGVPLLFTVKGNEPLVKRAQVVRAVPQLQPDGKIGFQVVVGNPRNVQLFVDKGELEVRRADGSAVGSLDVPESVVIVPGAERVLDVRGSLAVPPGSYTIRTSLDYGGATPAIGESSFTPHAPISIKDLTGPEQPGKGPLLKLVLANDGELGITPQIRVEIFDASGRSRGSAAQDRPTNVAPRQQAEISSEFPGALGAGDYVVRAQVAYGGQIAEKQ